jgi:hypothetical protein
MKEEKNRVVEELEGHVCLYNPLHTHRQNPLDFLHTHTTDRLNEVLFYYKRKWEGERERRQSDLERKEGPLEKISSSRAR